MSHTICHGTKKYRNAYNAFSSGFLSRHRTKHSTVLCTSALCICFYVCCVSLNVLSTYARVCVCVTLNTHTTTHVDSTLYGRLSWFAAAARTTRTSSYFAYSHGVAVYTRSSTSIQRRVAAATSCGATLCLCVCVRMNACACILRVHVARERFR